MDQGPWWLKPPALKGPLDFQGKPERRRGMQWRLAGAVRRRVNDKQNVVVGRVVISLSLGECNIH